MKSMTELLSKKVGKVDCQQFMLVSAVVCSAVMDLMLKNRASMEQVKAMSRALLEPATFYAAGILGLDPAELQAQAICLRAEFEASMEEDAREDDDK